MLRRGRPPANRRPHRPRRRGFTLVELLVALAIFAALGIVLLPSIMQRLRGGDAAGIAGALSSLRTAIYDYRGHIGRFPKTLDQLATQPTTGALDLCDRTVPIDFTIAWKGPYVTRPIGSAGIPVGGSTVANALRRDPATLAGGTYAVLLVDVTNVDQAVADRLEASFDGNASFTTGAIRWTDLGGGRGTLSLAIPIRGC